MKILYWKIRGIGNPPAKIALKNIFILHKPDIYFISELMFNHDQISSWYWSQFNITKLCVNT